MVSSGDRRARADPVSDGAAPRAVAARVLDAVLHRGRSLKAELADALPQLEDARDRALVEAICFAVLRQPARLAEALKNWMPKPLARRDGELRALVFAGLAQLDPLQLPPHAAVAATVEAARVLGRRHQAGLVNALLRRAQREGLPPVDAAAHWPSWLRRALEADWPGEFDSIVQASQGLPPQWLRVNLQRQSRDAYRERLLSAGIHADTDPHLPAALRLDVPASVAALPGFSEGDVSVQDAAAQMVAELIQPPTGARVLDACAAPGGKTAHLIEQDPTLRVTALDVDARRLQRVRETLARLRLADRTALFAADAAAVPTWWDGEPFQAVLVDAPCSATGIVRRQPDVLLHRREADLAALLLVQARLMDSVWSTLEIGGVMAYTTCSILKAENEGQVAAFLARTPDARAEPVPSTFGRESGVGRQRLPGEMGRDGFYYARIRKIVAAQA